MFIQLLAFYVYVSNFSSYSRDSKSNEFDRQKSENIYLLIEHVNRLKI